MIFYLAFSAFMTVGLAYWLAFVLFPQFYVDRTRQSLFCLRDRMFIDAAKGLVPMDSNSYKMTRVLINGSIRFTHDLCITRLVVSRIRSAKNPQEHIRQFRKDYENSLEQLTSEEREYLSGIWSEWASILNRHVISVSWTMQFLRNILRLIGLFFRTTLAVSNWIDASFESIREDEIIEGIIERDPQALRLAPS